MERLKTIEKMFGRIFMLIYVQMEVAAATARRLVQTFLRKFLANQFFPVQICTANLAPRKLIIGAPKRDQTQSVSSSSSAAC